MRSAVLTAALLALLTLGIVAENRFMQFPCPSVARVRFPVDPQVFQIVQGYAVPNVRHHGRYHTGEDYFAGSADATLGQPVRAIANGRVTYAYPLGWGRDGGVVILEHVMPDGTVYYSQYGHLRESDRVKFPMPFTCIEEGAIIGVIGDARPAPHLHFEIRTGGRDLPGPGYTWMHPDDDIYLNPSGFISMYYNE